MNALSSLNDALFISDEEFVLLTMMHDICNYACWNGKGLFKELIKTLNDTIIKYESDNLLHNAEVMGFYNEVSYENS